MNYIITNDLKSSKLGAKIAAGLGINPEWLILGVGKVENKKLYEVPIINSPYMLKQLINNQLDIENLDYLVSETFLGEQSFAFLIETNKIILCSNKLPVNCFSYLTLNGLHAYITENNDGENSFPIFEWRIRNVDF